MKIINFYFLLSITFTLLIKSTKGYTIYGYDNIDFGDDSEIDSDMESDYEIEDEGRHYFIFISNPTGKGEDEEFKEHINFYIQEIHDLINLYKDDYKDPSVLEQMEKIIIPIMNVMVFLFVIISMLILLLFTLFLL